MGSGIDAARAEAPEHAKVLDDFKDQLLIVLLQRAAAAGGGGKVKIPVEEIDATGEVVVAFAIVDRTFVFEVRKKS